MLKTYVKVKSAALVALLTRRLLEAPPEQRDELARNLKDEADIYPRPLLLIFAIVSCAIAVLAIFAAIDARKSGNGMQLTITAPGAIFFAWCAWAWFRRWIARA
jgi:hypothetical protein